MILNQDGDESTNGLTHRIHYGEINGRDREFYATWKDMGMYYRYCHASDHGISKCPTRPSQGCFNCNKPGHIAVNCPHLPNEMPHKQARKTTSSVTDHNSLPSGNKSQRQKATKKPSNTKKGTNDHHNSTLKENELKSSAKESPNAGKNLIRLPSAMLAKKDNQSVNEGTVPKELNPGKKISVLDQPPEEINWADSMEEDAIDLLADMAQHGERILERNDDSKGPVTRSKSRKNNESEQEPVTGSMSTFQASESGTQASRYNPLNQDQAMAESSLQDSSDGESMDEVDQ